MIWQFEELEPCETALEALRAPCIAGGPVWSVRLVQPVAFDATGVLLEWARWCALQVVDLWEAPEVVLHFLKTGKGAAEAARAAAGVSEAARAESWAATGAMQNAQLELMLAQAIAPVAPTLRERLEQDRDDRHGGPGLRALRLMTWKASGLPGLDLVEVEK